MVSMVTNPAPAPPDEMAEWRAVAPDAPLLVVLNLGSGNPKASHRRLAQDRRELCEVVFDDRSQREPGP
jgi:hypothetical protein